MNTLKKLIFIFLFSITLFSQVFSEIKIKVSKAMFINGITESEENANKHGVFPVLIEWNEVPGAKLYKILKNTKNSKQWTEIAQVTTSNAKNTFSELSSKENISLLSSDGGSILAFTHNDENAIPNSFTNYKIEAYASNLIDSSAEQFGWGALTALTYMNTYNENVIKSHSKLTLMHKRINLQKLGKENALGDTSGYLAYHAKVKGLNGVVTMEYSNYCERVQWILNGNSNTKANIFANGKMFGTVKCTGMYPGSVSYDDVEIKKGKANGGFYTISRKGFPDVTIKWDAILSEINKLYKESEN